MLPTFWIFVAGFAGLLAGCVFVLVGGLGVTRRLSKRMDGLESDLDHVDMKVSRETKRRAGLAAADARSEAKSDKEIQKEAALRLAAESNTPKIPVASGFPSIFNRGG